MFSKFPVWGKKSIKTSTATSSKHFFIKIWLNALLLLLYCPEEENCVSAWTRIGLWSENLFSILKSFAAVKMITTFVHSEETNSKLLQPQRRVFDSSFTYQW